MDKDKNKIKVSIFTESGCDPEQGEYELLLVSIQHPINLDEDIDLIKEAVVNEIDFSKLPEEGTTFVTLVESGEWEDVFWHKYYKVDSYESYEAGV